MTTHYSGSQIIIRHILLNLGIISLFYFLAGKLKVITVSVYLWAACCLLRLVWFWQLHSVHAYLGLHQIAQNLYNLATALLFLSTYNTFCFGILLLSVVDLCSNIYLFFCGRTHPRAPVAHPRKPHSVIVYLLHVRSNDWTIVRAVKF